MARYLCDTSASVAAVSTWHERHDRTRTELQRRTDAGEELVLAAHSLVETYAVLTRLPGHRLRVDDAFALIQANWADTPVAHRMYDVLIAVSALKAGASTILTWNARHFAPFADEIGIQAPP